MKFKNIHSLIFQNLFVIKKLIISRAGHLGTYAPTFGHGSRHLISDFECIRCHFLSACPEPDAGLPVIFYFFNNEK